LYIALSLDTHNEKLKYIAYWKEKISSFTPEKSHKYTEWKNGAVKKVNERVNLNFLDYTFCTEFILKPNSKIEKDNIYNKLSNLGNSIVIIDDEKGFKIHIHTNVPEKIITLFERIGSISDLKIDNMYFQHQHYINNTDISYKSRIYKNIGTLSIVSSDGLADLMYSIGVDRVIVTAPTLTELISQVGTIDAQNVIVLPNDEKLFPIINEAISVSHKKINIIESKSIPEIISSMIQFDSSKELSENLKNMSLALHKVKYAEIIDVGRLNNGIYNKFKDYSFIGISAQKVLSYGDSKNQVLKEAIDNLINENISLITIFSGKNHSEDELTRLKIFLENTYRKINVEIIDTKQPESYFIVSLE
jgi:dihydroxyacetone kinase-like predicted kinase